MTGDGVVGSQRQAGNRLTSTTVLGWLDTILFVDLVLTVPRREQPQNQQV